MEGDYQLTSKKFNSCAQLYPTLRPHGLWPARLLCLWDLTGQNAGVGCLFLLQGIFPTQGSNPRLLSLASPALAGRSFTTSTTWKALSEKENQCLILLCFCVSESCLQEAISAFKDNSPFLIFPQTYRRLHCFYSLAFLHFREVCLGRCYPCSSFLTNLYTGSGFNDVPANPIPLANNFCGF